MTTRLRLFTPLRLPYPWGWPETHHDALIATAHDRGADPLGPAGDQYAPAGELRLWRAQRDPQTGDLVAGQGEAIAEIGRRAGEVASEVSGHDATVRLGL